MAQAQEIGAGRAGRIDVDVARRPRIEELRLAMRRLDDDRIERARILAMGEKQRAVEQRDRPRRQHQDQTAGAEHGRAAGLLARAPGLERIATVAEQRDLGVELDRHEARIEAAAEPEAATRADPGLVRQGDCRRIGQWRQNMPGVGARQQCCDDDRAVAGGARARRIGRVGQDHRAVARDGGVDSALERHQLRLHVGAPVEEPRRQLERLLPGEFGIAVRRPPRPASRALARP